VTWKAEAVEWKTYHGRHQFSTSMEAPFGENGKYECTMVMQDTTLLFEFRDIL
jgi:hypothetical protein